MPCHHALAEALHAYIEVAGIATDRIGILFRTSRGRRGDVISEQPMGQGAGRCLARGPPAGPGCRDRRSRSAAIRSARPGSPPICSTAARSNTRKAMAAHESPHTTKLYDQTRKRLTREEVERIRL